jgi:hypothetical protein
VLGLAFDGEAAMNTDSDPGFNALALVAVVAIQVVVLGGVWAALTGSDFLFWSFESADVGAATVIFFIVDPVAMGVGALIFSAPAAVVANATRRSDYLPHESAPPAAPTSKRHGRVWVGARSVLGIGESWAQPDSAWCGDETDFEKLREVVIRQILQDASGLDYSVTPTPDGASQKLADELAYLPSETAWHGEVNVLTAGRPEDATEDREPAFQWSYWLLPIDTARALGVRMSKSVRWTVASMAANPEAAAAFNALSDEPKVAYEMDGWSGKLQAQLVERLGQGGVTHEFDSDGDLVCHEADEDQVELVIDKLLAEVADQEFEWLDGESGEH